MKRQSKTIRKKQSETNLIITLPDVIDGSRKTWGHIYAPDPKAIKSRLENFTPKTAPPRYIEQGKNERAVLETAQKAKSAVLLVGPTGIGKTLLVWNYAYEKKLPLLILIAHRDLTEGKMKGTQNLLVVPVKDEKSGHLHDMKVQTFSPSHLALTAMAPIPVVLFIDELHKIGDGVSSLLHSITNERVLYCLEATGDYYTLHPESLVIAAVNPSYGEGGLERIDAALRQRFSLTVDLEMPTGDTLKAIVEANIGPENYSRYAPLIDALVEVQKMIVNALEKDSATSASGVIDTAFRDPATLNSIIEAPSPRLLVKTLEHIIYGGLSVMTAIETTFVNPIMSNFGAAKKAILAVIEAHIPREYRNM